MKTTLNKIRAYDPCRSGWEKLLRGLNKTQPDDEPLWIDQILDVNGLDDALWCLRAVAGCDKEIRLYEVWCARRVQHVMTDPWSVAALDVAERHARGEASDEELAAARGLAHASWQAQAQVAARAADVARAARHFAYVAAYAAAACVGAAVPAAGVARDAERAAQADELRRVCREMRENG